ncbi:MULTISPECIES: HelD family protein [Streptomyces]|uniref:ATPase AAA n=1 Tax=Streptomyces viridochromogenes TaxID=1938 RepID=A0A0L8L9Q3_STRVR|nr:MULTISPECIES: ATP-binding domain-containing protein [Streptomyces]KOG34870.1 ATPase AAA [Streptomyces viridochromogenes]
MTPLDSALRDALSRERAHHDDCRAALTAMIDGAQEQVVVGEHASASGADAEVLGRRLRGQARDLRELPPGPLFFGRLDFARAPGTAGDHAGQTHHIGRMRIARDPSAPPLVVDWRAPVARAFYQAAARDPQGVAVRRRFGWSPAGRGDAADLTGLEDEHLAGDGPGGPGPGGNGVRPSGIVAAEIERPRTGPMRDIAATIQPEQDDLVREDFSASLCVQGAPGTGKTAVGLHRAAYLLYTHPQRVQRGGMLILGPHRAFLAHISQVLPALGETDVRQSTLDDEIARHPVGAQDGPAAAAIKHDVRMAEVLNRALYAHVRADRAQPLVLPDGSYRWRVPVDELERIVEDVRAEEPAYAVGRERVRTRVVRAAQMQAERRAGPRTRTWVRKASRARPVTALLDAVWPAVRPEQVLLGLLTRPDALAAAAAGVLDACEQRELLRAGPSRSVRAARWSAADLVLLDELAGLIERPEGYGHVVIDEAQDLSPMQCRAIARRSAFASLTVLGDLAQGTTPWAARDWPGLLAHLAKPGTVVTPLTTGFRVPRAVAELANRLLGHLDVDVPPARSLRDDGSATIEATHDTAAAVVAAVAAARERPGSIGVIAADSATDTLRGALDTAGVATAGPEVPGARVTVVPATAAKGLEYDHVIVVEPADIVEAEPRGLNRLYVALTRAVSELRVVHAKPLPAALAPAGASRPVSRA